MARTALVLVNTTPAHGPAPKTASATGSIRSSGTNRTSWPRARSSAAVRPPSGSGLVTRRRTWSTGGEEIRRGPALQFEPGIGAELGRVGDGAVARRLVGFAAVGPQDHPAERDRPGGNARMAGNGRAAGAVEHGEEGPFRADCRQGVGIVDRGEEIAGAAVVSAGFDPDRTLPHRRQKAVNLEDGGRGSGAAEPVEP